MQWRQYLLGTLALTGVVALLVWTAFFSNPLRGTVWVQVAEDGRLPTVKSYDLSSLSEAPFPYGGTVDIATVVQKTLLFDATEAPDGVVAYLSKSKGEWQVFFSERGSERVVTDTPTIKRHLTFSPDGLSLAYAEISATSTAAERVRLSAWRVVRMLRTGDSIVVGNGIRPRVLRGAETAVLTERGIESVALGREPELLLKSVVPVTDTPFAVSRDGTRIAWINPADHALQVFTYTPARTYEPLLTMPNMLASSIVFSDSGDAVLLSRTVGSGTVLTHVAIPSGVVHESSALPLRATILTWNAQ